MVALSDTGTGGAHRAFEGGSRCRDQGEGKRCLGSHSLDFGVVLSSELLWVYFGLCATVVIMEMVS